MFVSQKEELIRPKLNLTIIILHLNILFHIDHDKKAIELEGLVFSSHRHFSASTSCHCHPEVSNNTMVEGMESTDNITKSAQFHDVSAASLNNDNDQVPSIEVCHDLIFVLSWVWVMHGRDAYQASQVYSGSVSCIRLNYPLSFLFRYLTK